MAKTSTTLRLDEQFYEDLSVAMIRRKVPSLQSLVVDLLEQQCTHSQCAIRP